MDSSTPFRLPRKTPFGIGENVAEWATGALLLNSVRRHGSPMLISS
ncbi:hypothetical protein [Vibrio parahaemolyticus]